MKPSYDLTSVDCAIDSRGSAFPLSYLPQVFVYSGDNLDYIEATDGTNTWRQTYTYTAGKLTAISAWVPQ